MISLRSHKSLEMKLKSLFWRIAAFFGYVPPQTPVLSFSTPNISIIEPPHGLDEVMVAAVIKEIQEKLDRDIINEIYLRGNYAIRY
jgi:hypothetical protein